MGWLYVANWSEYVEGTVSQDYERGLDLYVRYSKEPLASYVHYKTSEYTNPIYFDKVTQWHDHGFGTWPMEAGADDVVARFTGDLFAFQRDEQLL